MPPNHELYLIADELRAIGNMRVRFAENSYDTERYERVRAASARIVAALERRSPDEVLERYDDNLVVQHLSIEGCRRLGRGGFETRPVVVGRRSNHW